HYGARVCAAALLGALLSRRHSGRGAHVEVSQAEIIMAHCSEFFLASSLGHPEAVEPRGSASQRGVPWSVYPCDGDDEWCVIAVGSDDEWRRLKDELGNPEWAAAPALETVAGRTAERELIDHRLAEWTATFAPRQLMSKLQRAGVPAAMM